MFSSRFAKKSIIIRDNSFLFCLQYYVNLQNLKRQITILQFSCSLVVANYPYDIDTIDNVASFSKMPLCIQHGRNKFYFYYPLFPSQASDKEGSLQTRPGTDYFQRNCNPEFTPVDMMDVGSSMTSFVGSGSGSETSVIESASGGFSRPTSPQGRILLIDFKVLYIN